MKPAASIKRTDTVQISSSVVEQPIQREVNAKCGTGTIKEVKGRGRLPSMTWVLSFGFLGFLLWAGMFEIDRAVQSQGQIIPSARTQIIQVADGGVLAELLVQEGQQVVEGEVLAVLEKERANASYQESLAKVSAQYAALIRAKAEIKGRPPVFGAEFDEFQDFVSVQLSYYQQRKQTLEDELRMLESSLEIAQEELQISESLLAGGDTSRIEVMRARRYVTELKGKITGSMNKYLQEAQQEAARLEAELASSRYKLAEKESVLNHTELVSPADGVVKYMKINTLGGVLRTGDELMQISPTEDGVVIEVKINPVDIGQLELDLPVAVSLDAFDYSIYGNLAGTLSYISSDTLTETAGEQSITYYRARIHINENALSMNPKLSHVVLKPGMTVNTSIRTGKRTVLQYLLKPIIRGFSGALTER